MGNMNIAFVLGNGQSRLGLDLHSLRSCGKIFGCNALYRDFAPDVLIATDPGISKEIENSGYPEYHEFFTRKPQHKNSKIISKNFGYSSGPIAVTYAAMEGFNKIYLIGFDLVGYNGKHNNVYSGTANYKSLTSDPTYYGNWVNQIKSIAIEYDYTEFVRVGTDTQHCPAEWKRHNIKFQTINEFLSEVNTVSWQKQNE
jgi:hypothetical protein